MTAMWTQASMTDIYAVTNSAGLMEPATHWAVQNTILALCTATIVINPVTLTVMVREKLAKKSSINVCITSLCCSDLLFGLGVFFFYLPFVSIELAAGDSGLRKARFSITVCAFPAFVMSSVNCLLITLDRTIATLFPLKYKSKMTSEKTSKVVIALWLLTALFSVLVSTAKVVTDGEFAILEYPNELLPVSLYNYFVVPGIIVGLLTNVVLCAVIVKSLAKSAHRVHLQTTSNYEKHTRRITRMVVLVISVMLLGNLPIVVTSAALPCTSNFSTSQMMSYRMAFDVCVAISVVPTFVNNFIYFGRIADFEKHIAPLFCYKKRSGSRSGSVIPLDSLNSNSVPKTSSHHNERKQNAPAKATASL